MTKTTVRNVLSAVQKFNLQQYIVANYATFGKGDSAFAEHVSTSLGFEVNGASVKHYRSEFGIEQIKDTNKKVSELDMLKATVTQLQSYITSLQTSLSVSSTSYPTFEEFTQGIETV
jgi:hypothetical protein